MNNRETLIWLNTIKGIGSKTIDNLEKFFGDISIIWDISNSEINRLPFIKDIQKNRIIKSRNEEYYNNQIQRINELGIKVITSYDEEYPERLKNIYNYPKVMYINGTLKKEDDISIAIVGSRKATAYGRWAAEKFACELARLGITVISGMARGIDTMAHRGALEEKGRTLAVLGSGIDVIYPKSNRQLYKDICETGAVISEFPIGTQPLPQNFPQRNRIISGLALGIIVIEAGLKSGSLITAEHAIEQGKEVFALPGNINSIYSKGTNLLIKDGAKILMDIDDILEEIMELKDKCSYNQKRKINDINLSSDELEIVKCISEKPTHCDMITYHTGINISKVTSILTILEMKGIIKQLPGKIFTIC